MSDKTKSELKEQISQIELQQKAEEARCPVRLSFAQIAEARGKQELWRRRQEEDEKLSEEAKRKCTRICPHELCKKSERATGYNRPTYLYSQVLNWNNCDFFNAMSPELKAWVKLKSRLKKPREDSSDSDFDGRGVSPRRCLHESNAESQG